MKLIEKRKKKQKKYSFDSLLPRSGLNPVILPSIGPQAWASFNTAMGGEISTAMFESADILNEASYNPRGDVQLIQSALSSHMQQLMDGAEINNGDIQKALDSDDWTNFTELAGTNLSPRTADIVFVANKWGGGNPQADAEGKVEHHILGIHPAKGAGNDVSNHVVLLKLQDHTRLHNAAFKRAANYLKELDGIKDVLQTYREIASKINANISNPQNDIEYTNALLRRLQLKAWFVREIWSKYANQTLGAVKEYKQSLLDDLKKYTQAYPDVVRDTLKDQFDPIKINGVEYYILINDFKDSTKNKTALEKFQRAIINGELKYFPSYLKNEFIAAIPAAEIYKRTKAFTDLDEFLRATGLSFGDDTVENLTEDVEPTFKAVKPYLFNNYLYSNLVNSTYKNIPEKIKKNLQSIKDKAFWSSTPLESIWQDITPKGIQLKQSIIKEFLRYFFLHNNLILETDDKIDYNQDELKYQIKSNNVQLKVGTSYYDLADDLKNKKSVMNLEDILEAYLSKQIINLSISDPHFLDASGNIVPGITFGTADRRLNGRYGNYNETFTTIKTSKLFNPKLLHTIIIDFKTYYLGLKWKEVLKEAHVEKIIIDGNVLRSYALAGGIQCQAIEFKNFTDTYLPSYCFSNITVPSFDTIPLSVQTIGEGCFEAAHIKSIYIPDTVKTLEKDCFNSYDIWELKFEITKQEYELARKGSRYSNKSPYAGYNSNWGKSIVEKGGRVTWGNTTTLELESMNKRITEELDIAVVNKDFDIYLNLSEEDLTELLKELQFKNPEYLAKQMIENYTGNKFLNTIYLKDRKNNDLYIYAPREYATDSTLVKYNKDSNYYENKYLFDWFLRNHKLAKALIWDCYTIDSSLNILRDILRDRGIKKSTLLDDEAYFEVDFLPGFDSLFRDSSDYSKVDNFFTNLKAGDYMEALASLDIDIPELNSLKDKIEESLNKPEILDLAKKYNIDFEALKSSINDNNNYTYYVKKAAKNTIIQSLIRAADTWIKDTLNERGLDITRENKKVYSHIFLILGDIGLPKTSADFYDQIDRLYNVHKTVKNRLDLTYSYGGNFNSFVKAIKENDWSDDLFVKNLDKYLSYM